MLYPESQYAIEIAENPHSNSFSLWFKHKPEDLVYHLLRAMKFRSRSYGKEFYHPNDTNAMYFAEELQQTLRNGCLPKLVHYIPTHEPSEHSITNGKFSIATIYYQNSEQKTVHYEFVVFENSRPARESFAWLIAHIKHGKFFKRLHTSEKVRINEAIKMFQNDNFQIKLPTPFGGEPSIHNVELKSSCINSKITLSHLVKEDGNEDRKETSFQSNLISIDTSDSELYKGGKTGSKEHRNEDGSFHVLPQLYKGIILEEERAFNSEGKIIPIRDLGDSQLKILKDFKHRTPVKTISLKSANGKSEQFDSWERVELFIANWRARNISSKASLEVKISWKNGCSFQMSFDQKSFIPFLNHLKNLLGRVVYSRLLNLFELHENQDDNQLSKDCPKPSVLKLIQKVDFGFPVHTYFATADFRIPIQEIKIDTGDSKATSIDASKSGLPFDNAIKQLQFVGSFVDYNHEIQISFEWIDGKEVRLPISIVDIPAAVDSDFIEQLLQLSFEKNELRYYQTADQDALINSKTIDFINRIFKKTSELVDYSRNLSEEVEAISEKYYECEMQSLGMLITFYYTQLNVQEKRLFYELVTNRFISCVSIDELFTLKTETPAQVLRFHNQADQVFTDTFDFGENRRIISAGGAQIMLQTLFDINRWSFNNTIPSLRNELAFEYLLPWSSLNRLKYEEWEINHFDWQEYEFLKNSEDIEENNKANEFYNIDNLQGTYGIFSIHKHRESVGTYFINRNLADIIWKITYKHGFNGGLALNPTGGTGTLIETASTDVQLTVFEECEVKFKVLENFYPSHKIVNQNLMNYSLKNSLNKFDLVVGHLPFYSIKRNGYLYHRIDLQGEKDHLESEIWYLKKGLELLKTNGLLVCLITSFFMKDKSHYVEEKRQIERMANLKALYRLPLGIVRNVPTTFDIIVFQKKSINAF